MKELSKKELNTIYKNSLKNFNYHIGDSEVGLCFLMTKNGLNIYTENPNKTLPEELKLFVCTNRDYWLDLGFENEDHEVRKTILMFCIAMTK